MEESIKTCGSNHRITKLKVRVLVPLLLAFIFLLGTFLLISYTSEQKVLRHELAEQTELLQKLFLVHLEEEGNKLSVALSTITLNKELTAALEVRDRERLQSLTASYFTRLQTHSGVTHLYFTGPGRVNILRVHQPERFGDRIDRFTLIEAERTGREARGMEIGPLGTLTLRVVAPWHDGERVIGYVEMGVEVDHFLQEMQQGLNSRVCAFINKDCIRREQWAPGNRLSGRTEPWDRFPETVAIGSAMKQIPERVVNIMAQKLTRNKATDADVDGKNYRIAFASLIDAGKHEVGHIAMLSDTTAITKTFRQTVLLVSVIYFLIGGLLFLVFNKIVGQIEVKICEAHEKLTSEKESLLESEETIRRLNAELELTVEERTGQLLDVREELMRKEKLAVLGQLSGSVGHELRNPLGVMSNAIYYLKMVNIDADETTREYLDMIENEIGNSQRIISDLLDFSRKKEPQTIAISAKELIRQSLAKCTVPVNVKMELDIPEELPGVTVDPFQMGQVFQNLVTNAIQAMPDGGTLRIAARQDLNGDFVEISVEDSGEGIGPENMRKLFQPLFTTKAKGIGLGLVVTRELTEANGGTIEVKSEPGNGATFTVCLRAQKSPG